MSTLRNHFNVSLKSKWKECKVTERDKYTADNWLRLQEYMAALEDVDRRRLRFYDQTGCSFKDLLTTKRRCLDKAGLPPPQQSSMTSASNTLCLIALYEYL
jgi:hypothetical protein